MAKYNLVHEVEAYELGSKPEPAWLEQFKKNGSIKDKGDGSYLVGAPYGWAYAAVGDYLIYDAPIFKTVTDDEGNEAQELVKPMSIDAMGKADFEATYQLLQGEHPADADHL